VVVLATLVVPVLVYLRPPALPFQVAFIVLPLVPAVLLGATAVYVAVRGRQARGGWAPGDQGDQSSGDHDDRETAFDEDARTEE
jgi:hypothetical protein